MTFKVVNELNPIGAMNILQNKLQPMYEGTFIYLKKATWQTRHNDEQEFGDLCGLPAQNDFPSILTKH